MGNSPKVVVAVLALGLAGCGDTESPSAPPTPPAARPAAQAPPPAPPPAATFRFVVGYVQDTGFRPIADARVEVVDGQDAGLATATDATGRFSLTGTFDEATTFRATREGHVAATRTPTCSSSCSGAGGAAPWLAFSLAVTDPPVDVAGAYTLTFVADPACPDLPGEGRRRTYDATVREKPASGAPAGTSFELTARGATFLDGFDRFGIGVAGDHVGFWLYGGHNAALVEQVAANAYVAISGTAEASVGPGDATISAPFDGWLETYGSAFPYARCESKDHRLILARR